MEDISNIIEDQRGLLDNLKRTSQRFDSKSRVLKTRGYVQTILEAIESVCQQFTDTHHLISLIRERSIRSDDVPYFSEEIFEEFQDFFQMFKGRLLDINAETQQPHSPIFHSSTFHASTSRQNTTIPAEARLPKIDIPTFSGDYLSWISYRDMFVSLVHRSCSGTPLDIVNEYPASEENYDLAWDALNRRYHNRRKIVSTLLSKLFSIPNSNGTAESIQNILDTTRNCLALINTLGVTKETYDAIIIHITVNRLDVQSRKEWEQSLKATVEIPKIRELFSFLETSFRTLESLAEPTQSISRAKTYPNSRNNFRRNIHITTSNDDSNCPCCNRRHFLYKCFKFISMPSNEKRELMKTKRICHNCLNVGHFSRECRSTARCQTCQQKHHTIVHNEFTTSASTDQISSNRSETTENSSNIAIHCSALAKPQVLLATMRVSVKTYYGTFSLRAMLDHCAQATLITENASQTLRLQSFKTFAQISGVCINKSITTHKYVNLVLQSRTEPSFELKCSALVVPSITHYQPIPTNKGKLPNIDNFQLADPEFLNPGEIDLLLGGDVYGEIILPDQKKFENNIFLQYTHFGWVVSGPTSKFVYSDLINVNICSLEEQLKAFWLQEELLEKRKWTEEEELCERYFKATTTRDSTGRYKVALPFKNIIKGEPMPMFSMTDYSALSRLKNIEAKCKQNPKFGDAYYKFMTEYENLDHMKAVGVYPNDLGRNCYFLPHHGVWRESSSTTKLRVVFDGSAKNCTKSSLNDELAAGPALQNDLPTTVIRWRRFKVGFRSDLEKMFRQINVINDHQKYQQILWRKSANSDINIYKLSTVTYGTTSAPFLSMRVLHQLAEDETENYPTASKVLISDTYVDDIISGADSYDEAILLQQQLSKMLKKGGFTLRKWISNDRQFISSIPIEYREIKDVF
ncbi:uncharacterized protein LOC119607172 [Lucilia sericata]|uniref:uncharacterized protein LOC119607172 n=1 Tax=Lucilia sericata TaxID=13632 RepID=UPI0018A80A6D|nr:uncharacterized protein LOC119607172 [Lucilia sericata]